MVEINIMKKLKFFSILFLISSHIFGQSSIDIQKFIKPDSVNLFGLLSIPQDSFEYFAIIIPGSGPTDLNGNGPMTKGSYLKKLSDSLCMSGIASLRIDKRGIAGSSDAKLKEYDMTLDIMVDDVVSWVKLINAEYPHKKITIIGHSEGSLVGMLASQKTNGTNYISIAGMGRPMDVIILEQLEKQAPKLAPLAEKMFDTLKMNLPIKEVNPFLLSLFRTSVQPFIKSAIAYDPAIEIQKLNIPSLIIQGDTDIQVSVKDAELLYKNAKDGKLVIIEGMNHVFVKAPEERFANIATYMETDLNIQKELTDSIIEFINK